MKTLVVLLFALSVAAGCGTAAPDQVENPSEFSTLEVSAGHRHYTGFYPITEQTFESRGEDCNVGIILDGTPGPEYTIIGYAFVERTGSDVIEQPGGEEQAIAWLHEVACRVGGTIIFNIETSSFRGPYVGRSIRGTAVVAVLGVFDEEGTPSEQTPADPQPTQQVPPPAQTSEGEPTAPQGASEQQDESANE